jgi:catechol 2,3-dioxygenase-like lactoylglutathione lyase family enzyme
MVGYTPTFRNPQVNLYVRDAKLSARFYRDLFGFEEMFRTPERGTPIHIELKLGSLTLGVGTIDSVSKIHGFRAGGGPPRAEVVLWTDDVDDAYARLTAEGARPLSAPHDFLAGRLRAAWVADPDGNPVQLVTRRVAEGDG